MYHTSMGPAGNLPSVQSIQADACLSRVFANTGRTLPSKISGAAHSVGRRTAPGALPQGSWTATPALAGAPVRFGTMGVTQAGNRGHSPAAADRLSCIAPVSGVGRAARLGEAPQPYHSRLVAARSFFDTKAPRKGHGVGQASIL